MTLTRPVGRLVALALLFALCWSLATMVVVPLVRQIVQERDEAASTWSLLARYRQLETTLPALQRQLDGLSAFASGKAFLQGKSPALLTAEMQSTAQRLASSAGVTLRSSRTLPLSSEEGFNRVGVDLDITASTAALTALLRSVEAAEPAIFVERLAVQVPENGIGAKSTDGQPLLTINLRLNSYAQLTAAKARLP
jgi:hypothetical protein